MRAQEFGAESVSGRAGVQFVFEVEVGFGHSIGSDGVGPKVDKSEVFASDDEIAQQLVGLLLFVALRPPLWTGVEIEQDDLHLRQGGSDFGNVGFEIGEYLFRRLSEIDVIATRMNDDGLGLVVDGNAVGEINGIRELGSTQAAINHGQSGEIRRERVPQTDAGGTGEEDGAFGWWCVLVGLFISKDLGFKGIGDGWFGGSGLDEP